MSDNESSFSVDSYQWNTAGCYNNNQFTNFNSINGCRCFPHSQTSQSVTGNNLLAEDAGTITCTARIGTNYESASFTLRIR